MTIHPTAIVSSRAEIGSGVDIGPYCIVEPGVRIGDGCRLVAQVNLREGTTLGPQTTVCEGAVLGGLPQHTQAPDNPGTLAVGARNSIREHVTIHRAMTAGAATVIGDDCMLMVGSHVAHDCQIGNHVILTNGVMLGGHVEIGDRACLGGNAAVHQFTRIGRLAMIGGCTKLVRDVPPFLLTDGTTAMIVGLNKVGLRRAGFHHKEVSELKAAYRLIYREGLPFEEMLAALESQFSVGAAAEYAKFFSGGQRGFVQERRNPPKVTLRVHPTVDEDEVPEVRRMAG